MAFPQVSLPHVPPRILHVSQTAIWLYLCLSCLWNLFQDSQILSFSDSNSAIMILHLSYRVCSEHAQTLAFADLKCLFRVSSELKFCARHVYILELTPLITEVSSFTWLLFFFFVFLLFFIYWSYQYDPLPRSTVPVCTGFVDIHAICLDFYFFKCLFFLTSL